MENYFSLPHLRRFLRLPDKFMTLKKQKGVGVGISIIAKKGVQTQ